MPNLFWKSLLATPALLGATLVVSGAALAVESTEEVAERANVNALEQISNYSNASIQLAQVTSVSELSDVQPSDWAFTALQRLVEEYGCIEGFPNRTYRGNQAMTRYEFAAGLNACLDVIVQLIGTSITAEELATIRRLQEEFQSELATLRGRVDALEADVAELEANQFSTTTKLRGQVDAHVTVPFDEAFDGEVTTFEYRARLNFDTSFTGEDRLRLRFQAGTNDGAARGFPAGLDNVGGGDNDVTFNDVYYAFPVGERIDVIVAGNSIQTDDFVTSTIVPFDGPAVGGAGKPLFYDFGMAGDSGLGVNVALTDNIVIDGGYSVESDAIGNPVGQGIFSGGGQSYIGQISYLSDGLIDAGFAYLHGNEKEGTSDVEATDTFAALINLDFGRFMVGGSGAIHEAVGSSDDTYSWQAGIALPDFVLEGSMLGVYGGQAPDYDGDEPFYVEGYYEVPISEYLTITPSVLYAEENDFTTGDELDESIYGVIRATFRF